MPKILALVCLIVFMSGVESGFALTDIELQNMSSNRAKAYLNQLNPLEVRTVLSPDFNSIVSVHEDLLIVQRGSDYRILRNQCQVQSSESAKHCFRFWMNDIFELSGALQVSSVDSSKRSLSELISEKFQQQIDYVFTNALDVYERNRLGTQRDEAMALVESSAFVGAILLPQRAEVSYFSLDFGESNYPAFVFSLDQTLVGNIE